MNNLKSIHKFLLSLSILIYNFVCAQKQPTSVIYQQTKYKDNIIGFLKVNDAKNDINFKYFIKTNNEDVSIENSLINWSKGKRVISVFTGSYMSECTPNGAKPLGLSLNEGKIINNTFNNQLGALVLINSTGKISIYNTKESDLIIQDQNNNYKNVNVKNALDRNYFLKWAQKTLLSAFQTHLLIFKNEIAIAPNINAIKSDRRFLLSGINDNGELNYFIISIDEALTLYNATILTLKFIRDTKILNSVNFMINLDIGCQNFYKIFGDNTIQNQIDSKKQTPLSEISNLIVIYEK